MCIVTLPDIKEACSKAVMYSHTLLFIKLHMNMATTLRVHVYYIWILYLYFLYLQMKVIL